MLGVNPYLTFPGTCAEAFKFYETHLGAKVVAMMPFAGSPMEGHVPPEGKDKILHATMTIGSQAVHGSDAPPERYQTPQGIAISISLADVAEAERIYKGLSEGGTVEMPIQETFWAARFAMFTDKFGIPWMINCETKK